VTLSSIISNASHNGGDRDATSTPNGDADGDASDAAVDVEAVPGGVQEVVPAACYRYRLVLPA
jgi:hypothetical protein